LLGILHPIVAIPKGLSEELTPSEFEAWRFHLFDYVAGVSAMTRSDLRLHRPASCAQLVLIDRQGNIHYQTPRLGDAGSMKEAVISDRIEELLNLENVCKARHAH